MDELEISGKRYISTRRAAKQYRYHSDYIGQLIRGKKLIGRKVGRSWYVEFESLIGYFGKEGSMLTPSELVARALPVEANLEVTEVETVVVKEETPSVSVATAQVVVPEEKKEIETQTRDSFHIPVRVHRPSFENEYKKINTKLTYISDDEPYIPTIQRSSLASTVVMPRSAEEVEQTVKKTNERGITSRPHKRSRIFIPALGIAALGVAVLIVIIGSSIFVSSHLVIEAGKAASAGYSLE
ncbi:MAG: hypothetical protein G01um101456_51 [Parcubacteria group bacterium Gr01-1014_56]|nr:MAG: hypothetical protein G01um101456_51 [Parcubacteria group bacterium Gr01-1014_56]